MNIRPSDGATALTGWLAESSTEADVQAGLSGGYIEWEGVRMKISHTQDWPLGNGLVTKMVWVEMNPETSNRLNTIMVRRAKR